MLRYFFMPPERLQRLQKFDIMYADYMQEGTYE